jgi:LCP family protein required for cell wall assembly
MKESKAQKRSKRFRLSCLGLLLLLVGGPILGGLFWWWAGTTQPPTNVLFFDIYAQPEEGHAVRSDTMILVMLYPSDPRIVLLSIPYNLYVEIPGLGPDRVANAHFWGELCGAEMQAEDFGPVFTAQTVAQNFGVPVYHYMRADYDGFPFIVDMIGGIDIVVKEPLVDHPYPSDPPGTELIEIPAGPQHMNGMIALHYARSRYYSADSDRFERQKQILIAMAGRMFGSREWRKLPNITQIVVDSIDTDLTVTEMMLLVPTLLRVGVDGIEYYEINQEMTMPGTAPNGEQVLLPRWEVIHPLMQELFMVENGAVAIASP